MGLAKLALVFGATLALAIPADESAAGGRSGRSHADSGSGHRGHSHVHGGFFFGGIIYTGPYYSYCRAANAYYPYVQSCPGGWERYLPSPQPHLG